MAIEIRGMAPLLQVFDMPSSIRFYRDVLGFTIAEQSQPQQGDDCDWVLLRLNEIELMLNTAYEKPDRPERPDPARVADHSDTAIYFGCPDIDATYNYLVAKDVAVKEPSITGYSFKALYLTDPDGYVITFHWPVSSSGK
ncbi:MAG: VOC family protein [Bacteroidota bacterium]